MFKKKEEGNKEYYRSNFITAFSVDYFYSRDFRRDIRSMYDEKLKNRMLKEMVNNPWGYLDLHPPIRAMRDGQTQEIYEELREDWDLSLLHNCYNEIKDIPIYEMNLAQRSVYTFYRDLYDQRELDPFRDEIDAAMKNISFDPSNEIDPEVQSEAYKNISKVLLEEPLMFNELPNDMRIVTSPNSEFYSELSGFKFELDDIISDIDKKNENGEKLSRRERAYLDIDRSLQSFLDNSYYYEKMMLAAEEEQLEQSNELYYDGSYLLDDNFNLEEYEAYMDNIPIDYYENLHDDSNIETLTIEPTDNQFLKEEDDFFAAKMDFDSGEIDVDEVYSKYVQEKMDDIDMFYDGKIQKDYDLAVETSMVLSDDENFNNLIIDFENGNYESSSSLRKAIREMAEYVSKNPDLYSLVPFEIINDGDYKTDTFFKHVKRGLAFTKNKPDYLLSNDILKYNKQLEKEKKINKNVELNEKGDENELYSR